MTELWDLIVEKFGKEDDISKYSCITKSSGVMFLSNKRGNRGIVVGGVEACGDEYGRKVRQELKNFSLKEYDVRYFDEGFAAGFFYKRRRNDGRN